MVDGTDEWKQFIFRSLSILSNVMLFEDETWQQTGQKKCSCNNQWVFLSKSKSHLILGFVMVAGTDEWNES